MNGEKNRWFEGRFLGIGPLRCSKVKLRPASKCCISRCDPGQIGLR